MGISSSGHPFGGMIHRYPLMHTLALFLLCMQAAHAQQSTEQDAHTLDAILVTSQGRTEELQKAAAPIAVFNEVQIQNAGISNTGDFVRLVPNMNFDESYTVGNSFVTMRGIQQINNSDAPVAIVVDGVPQNNQKEFRMDLFDIEQIEVLRGPQGALYGRNAVAGAVVINTKQASNIPEAYAQIGLGDHGLRKFNGSTSGPLVEDRLFYRFSVSGHDDDGTIKNSYTGNTVDWSRGHDLRGQLRWLAGERQEIELRLNRSQGRGSAAPGASLTNGNLNNSNIYQAPYSDIDGRSDRRIDAGILKYRWAGEALNVMSITGFTHLLESVYADSDYCNPVACPTGLFGLGQLDQDHLLKVYQLSQEIRLSSPEDAPVQWTTGAYLLDTRRKLRLIAHLLETDPVQFLVNNNETNANRAWALFGQVQFPLGDANRLEISLRHDHDRRRQTNLMTGRLAREGSWSAWQPKITWSHDIDDTRMVYATAGRGFRSGGFNGIGGRAFKPELLTSYEVGYKSSWLDNKLTFNSALFYEYDKDYQFFYINLGEEGGAQIIANLSRVEIMGMESELNWRVRPGFEVFASLGLLHSKIKETGPLSTNLPITKGGRAPRTEPYNAVIGAQWNFPIGPYRAMYRFDVSRNGRRTWEADNVYLMDPVTLVNTRFTFFSNRKWNLTAWASNLFNHRYYADFSSEPFSGLGGDIAQHAAGRRFGVDFRYDF